MKKKFKQLAVVSPIEAPLYTLSAKLADGVNYFCGIVPLKSGLKGIEWDTDKQYAKKMTLEIASKMADWLKVKNSIENIKMKKC